MMPGAGGARGARGGGGGGAGGANGMRGFLQDLQQFQPLDDNSDFLPQPPAPVVVPPSEEAIEMLMVRSYEPLAILYRENRIFVDFLKLFPSDMIVACGTMCL
jgi:hypothetical protein